MEHPDLLHLYSLMFKSRLFEEHVVQIWNDGLITGEMHTSIGEEAIYAGLIDHLADGDALALDHRTTSPSIIRGVDPKSLLLEFLGHENGLCSGNGGHMHIFSKSHLLASSGIVGASGPAALGFALAAQHLRPGKIALSFFGEGAANQGMMMESFNMAAALRLPVLFVCKDNGMAITTQSSEVTSGNLISRAQSFGMHSLELDGADAAVVWRESGKMISGIRMGEGPAFILAKCHRPQGHFLGDPLLRISEKPLKELSQISGPLIKSVTKYKGATLKQRMSSLKKVTSLLGKTMKSGKSGNRDPVSLLRARLVKESSGIEDLETEVINEIEKVVESVLNIYMERSES